MYGLTASTAWSVFHLIGCSWLGDEWDEEQLQIFLEESPGDAKLLSKHPMTSYIFCSQVNPAQRANNDLNRFITNKDVFTLGMLLIELCIK